MSEYTISQSDLSQFTGTTRWYDFTVRVKGQENTPPRHLLTDGVAYLVENAGAHWLATVVTSWQMEPKVEAESFQFWKFEVTDRGASGWGKGVVVATDGNEKEIARQEIDVTDFPLDSVEMFYQKYPGDPGVLMLTSEY